MMSREEPMLFYKRTVTPGTNLVDHARGLGIHLKSSCLTHNHSPRKGISSPRSRTTGLASRTAKSCPPTIVCFPDNTDYIEDVVIPLAANTDDQNVRNSMTPRPFSEKRAKSSLPNMQPSSLPNQSPRSSAKSIRTLSTFLEKYNVSSTPLDQTFLTRPASDYQRKWNSSEQALRFEGERRKREKGQVLKRTSEIKPHRIDRMYYMSGTHVGLSAKYDVDDAELERLKSLSQAREDSRHYGRGLSSHRGDKYNPTIGDKEPPNQPPPSSLSHNPDQHPIVPDGTIVNQEKETTVDDETVGKTRPSTGITLNKSEKIEEESINLEAAKETGEEDNAISISNGDHQPVDIPVEKAAENTEADPQEEEAPPPEDPSGEAPRATSPADNPVSAANEEQDQETDASKQDEDTHKLNENSEEPTENGLDNATDNIAEAGDGSNSPAPQGDTTVIAVEIKDDGDS